MAHSDARYRLGHGHGHRCHRYRHLGHGNGWRHSLSDGLCEGSRERRDLRVEVRRRSSGWGRISGRSSRGPGGSHQVLLGDGPRLQPGTAESGVGLSDAVVVGAHCTHRGRQILLRGSRCGGQSHHFGLAPKLGVLLQEDLIGGNEIGNLRNTQNMT